MRAREPPREHQSAPNRQAGLGVLWHGEITLYSA